MTKPSRILKALFVLVFAATHTLTSLSKMPIISVREGGTTVARHEAKQSETILKFFIIGASKKLQSIDFGTNFETSSTKKETASCLAVTYIIFRRAEEERRLRDTKQSNLEKLLVTLSHQSK